LRCWFSLQLIQQSLEVIAVANGLEVGHAPEDIHVAEHQAHGISQKCHGLIGVFSCGFLASRLAAQPRVPGRLRGTAGQESCCPRMGLSLTGKDKGDLFCGRGGSRMVTPAELGLRQLDVVIAQVAPVLWLEPVRLQGSPVLLDRFLDPLDRFCELAALPKQKGQLAQGLPQIALVLGHLGIRLDQLVADR